MRAWVRVFRLLVNIGREVGTAVMLGYVGASAIATVLPFLTALGLRPLIDGIVDDRPGPVVIGAALTAIALVLSVLMPAAYRWTTIRMRELSIMVMQRRLLTLSSTAGRVEHFERPEFWDRLQLLTRSSNDLTMGIALIFTWLLVVTQLLVAAGLLAQLRLELLLLPVVAVPAAWLARSAETLREKAELRTAEDRRSAQHLFTLATSAAPGKEVRLYGLADELLDRHARLSGNVHRGIEAAQLRAVAANAGGWVLFVLAYVGAVFLVVREAAAGRATAGDVALILALATAVVTGASQLSQLAGSTRRVLTTSEHYHWLEEQATKGRRGDRLPPARLERGVELDDVTFTYPGDERPALSDVSLQLPAGAVVAVVGENGAGKTTLVKLLGGMYAPTEGRTLVDGVDLAAIDLEAYRQRIAAGFQDFMRFELRTRETVGIGDLPRLDDEDVVRAALTKTNADFADRLPDGLETQLGLSWQGGVELSGGQWQKLALARSMVRTSPLLSILDEPTAALDPQTEHALFEQIAADAKDSPGRVTLLISHRFSTVRMADLIVVLDHGRVLEQGSHDELIARNGLYAELYHLQAHAYR
ncbi:ABC transporter ATP-binding protein [Actinopolymorpha alba]|uniref:ABC transporter ATP-binding protein n=1 Tax=Actinopolymorpha alba TaxID=533267 RepID=UPI00037C12E0|nr:ABC transporter ATP-binding protein [Actinopolymorpha alba]